MAVRQLEAFGLRTISVKVTEALANRLAAVTHRRGGSQAVVVREALEAYLGHGQLAGGSCLDLARDLAGAVTGAPKDLSTNRRRRQGTP